MNGISPKIIAKQLCRHYKTSLEDMDTSLQVSIQNLIYIAQGWHLALFNEPLCYEFFYAKWTGPTLRKGWSKRYHPSTIKPSHIGVIDEVWKKYSKFSDLHLFGITVKEDSPWWETWYNLGGQHRRYLQIDENLLRRYYIGIMQDNEAATKNAPVL